MILRKKSSDTSWNTIPTGVNKDGLLFGVSVPSANVAFACGTKGIIFKSTNGGDIWSDMTFPTERDLHAIYFYNEHHGFAVGDSGTILHTSNGGTTGIERSDEHPPDQFVLSQNFPNPFNPATTIKFQLPVNSHVTLRVFDCLGREVTILVEGENRAGDYSVRWDASSVSTGIYFYRLLAGVYSETKKAMFVK